MGSSGGGGGSSGKIDFPEYMKTWHGEFLGTGSASIDLTGAMNSAMTGASPYASYVGINANTMLLGSGKLITDFSSPFSYLKTYSEIDFETAIQAYRSSNVNGLSTFITEISGKIDTLMTAESALLEADINQIILPKYKAGMRNANAVMSSAFAIGEAIIRSQKLKDTTKADAALRYDAFKLNAELVLKNEMITMDYVTKRILSKRDIAITAMDFAKLYSAIKNELDDASVEMSAKDALWDLKVFQYGGNFLGSIAGSAVSTDKGDGGKLRSAVSGAIGGASMGFMFGGVPGAAIGGVAGAVAGLL